MITATFYTFSKKENSTAQPSSGTSLYVEIKDASSIFFPLIMLNRGAAAAPSFNYCYIPDFGRYYYITDWTWDRGLWIATLKCDVLATYKTNIGSASLYALRSSYSYDGSIPDHFYPTKAGCTFSKSDDWNISISGFSGCFVIGVVSKDGDFGSLKYYVVNSTNLTALTTALCSDIVTTINNFDPTDASLELQKALIDPLSYIKSCVYIPLTPSEVVNAVPSGSISVTDQQIMVSSWPITTAVGRVLSKPNPYASLSGSITIPKHPQSATRGKFVNNSPYTSMWLVAPGFGIIDLDTTCLTDESTLSLGLKIDLPTGLGILTISNSVGEIHRLTSNVGVPVQLSQILSNYVGAAVNTVGAVGSIIGGAMSGNIGGAISGAASGIGSAIESLYPKVQSVGSGGSYADIPRAIHLIAQFFSIVDDDITHHGRPLCQNITPSNYPGYLLIQDGDIAISGTQEEAQEIKKYLESGFYYE